MKLCPIFFDGDVGAEELREIFEGAGYHVRSDVHGRLVASRIPSFVRRDPKPAKAPTNVVPIKRRAAR